MNTLDKIIVRKKQEVEERKKIKTIAQMEASGLFGKKVLSLRQHLLDPSKTGIIAEFKKKSPSKGVINADAKPEIVTKGYEAAGASACSVLTDIDFFGGKDEDLLAARAVINIPILRKDFIVDEFQIIEARSLGADIILLIAAALDKTTLLRLAKFTKSLGMEVLLEVHDEEELKGNVSEYIDVVGVNNRNLKDFNVSLETSVRLLPLIPKGILKISESGISTPEDIHYLKQHGFNGFLIGENFMKTSDPGKAMKEFVERI